MIKKGDIIYGNGKRKTARRRVSDYLREHDWDEEDIKDISDDFIMGFMHSQELAWKDIEKEKVEEKDKEYGRWIYWDGWCGNHDMRIEDATCSKCGYKHPTVRLEQGDTRDMMAYDIVLNKLANECPKCGAIMQKNNI